MRIRQSSHHRNKKLEAHHHKLKTTKRCLATSNLHCLYTSFNLILHLITLFVKGHLFISLQFDVSHEKGILSPSPYNMASSCTNDDGSVPFNKALHHGTSNSEDTLDTYFQQNCAGRCAMAPLESKLVFVRMIMVIVLALITYYLSRGALLQGFIK